MIDAVLSYHTNGVTCGTAKFNQQLAAKLGVPFRHYLDRGTASHSLYSLKPDEIHGIVPLAKPYDLLLHALPGPGHQRWIVDATTAYAANDAIAREMRKYRPDVTVIACPSTIQGNPTRGAINVLTFGMAHKIKIEHYGRLKALLDASGADYTVSVSTAIHEGSPWDETVQVGDRLRALFPSVLRVLGYLADDALAREIRDCTAAAIFYDPAFRANNTSGWAVLEAGKPLITNCDADSPKGPIDIHTLTEWPDFWHFSRPIVSPPTWETLITTLQSPVHA